MRHRAADETKGLEKRKVGPARRVQPEVWCGANFAARSQQDGHAHDELAQLNNERPKKKR